MNDTNNNKKKLGLTRVQFITSLLITFVVGIVGTYAVISMTANPSDEPVTEETSELETEIDMQTLFGTADELAVVNQLYTILKTSYFEEIDSDILVEGALEGMAGAVGDPYTEYLDEIESTSFEEDISGSFEGIGAEVMKDGEFVRIVSPIANSPAEAAGLQPNDFIVEVDGQSVVDMTLNEAVALIRGPEGSDVELLIERGDNRMTVVLTRATIPIETVYYEVDEQEPTIGYVNIVNFNLPTYEETVTAIQDLEEQGIEKIVFDVRGNPGGLLTTAIQLANIFVPNGEPLMMTEYREDEEPTVYTASDDYGEFKYEGEAILLIDEGSASASEILAGAMHSVGIPLYGQTTFGKGTVQSVVSLGDSDEVKFTSGRWLTAEGDWINEDGITPDREVALPDYASLFVINPTEVYEQGQNSQEINNLKNVLSALGYSLSDNDEYDETVVEAVSSYQGENDLTVDGIVTDDTARSLTDSLRALIEANDTQYNAAIEAFQN